MCSNLSVGNHECDRHVVRCLAPLVLSASRRGVIYMYCCTCVCVFHLMSLRRFRACVDCLVFAWNLVFFLTMLEPRKLPASHISLPCLCSISELSLAHVRVHAITCDCTCNYMWVTRTCGLYDSVGGHVIRIQFLASKFGFCLPQLPGVKSVSPAMGGCGQNACGVHQLQTHPDAICR